MEKLRKELAKLLWDVQFVGNDWRDGQEEKNRLEEQVWLLLRRAYKAGQVAHQGTCIWERHKDAWGEFYWETGCGHAYYYEDGAPAENDLEFCPYCGRKLVEKSVE